MSDEEYKNWFARIKWWDDIIEAVPVTRIKKFRPQTLTDFNSSQWYRVKGIKESYSDGIAHSGWALIGLLTETLAEADKPVKRIGFPPVPVPSSDPDSSSTEKERLKEIYNQNTTLQQDKAKALLRQKKQDHVNSFNNFAANFMNAEDPSKENREEVTMAEKQDKQKTAVTVKSKGNCDKQKLEAMEQKIKQLEDDLKKERLLKKRKVESSVDKKLDEYVAQLNQMWLERERSFRNTVQEDFQKYQKFVQSELEKMNKLLSERLPASSTQTSAGSSSTTTTSERTALAESVKKVVLSSEHNIMITQHCYFALQAAKCDADWGNALLRGIFGEEASLYRVFPRNRKGENKKKFPKSFLDKAKELYSAYAVEQQYEPAVVQANLTKLPAYLSDLASNMWNSEMKTKTTTKRDKPKNQKEGGDHADQADQAHQANQERTVEDPRPPQFDFNDGPLQDLLQIMEEDDGQIFLHTGQKSMEKERPFSEL